VIMYRPRFWRTLPAFMVVVGCIGALSGLGGVGFALGTLIGVVLAALTELFRWDCGPQESFWFPPRQWLPPLEYQEKFRPSTALLTDEGISARPMNEAIEEIRA
jgi:hypothetical protein